MSHLLYYWRGDNYRKDLDFGVGYHLNQASSRLHDIAIGESLWAFTRRTDGVYVLAAQLVVKAKTLNQDRFRYGRHRVWGDLERSRYFAIEGQPDITHLLRSELEVKARGDVLGRAFQGAAAIRVLSDEQHQRLIEYSRPIPPEPRARLLPEEQLEALMLQQNPDRVEALLAAEDPGLAEKRRHYLYAAAKRRSREHVEKLREIYGGRCQVTGWDPRTNFGLDLCEAHHIRWLSRGGDDELSNMILISPNIHRAIHRADAPFDWSTLTFIFGAENVSVDSLKHELIDQ